MRSFTVGAAVLLSTALNAQALNIISSNDDGWAEINIRTFYNALTSAGHDVVISAPADNQSGTGSRDEEPSELEDPCQFNSCPAGSPAVGFNQSEPRFNYVNSYPVTSIKHGIDTLSPKFFGGAPDLAVAGPNTGNNLGATTAISGTVGAATYAAHTAKIPAIAFSGVGSETAWNESTPLYSQVYADLATNLTDTLIAAGTPYLPEDIWLNVNFAEVTEDKCSSVDQFQFVLTRIFKAFPLITPDDVDACGETYLPTETSVVRKGCFVTVSVGTAENKKDADSDAQKVVLEKLGSLLTCLPKD
ncbi:5'/3'-nucleotidase SurE [Helicocarpus griseus UAMH5409]|uniref:5'/3'-nucleotidase SurE n=1 Tax=Helicocarpus griseus UAMH5409 TaxID=1447875 RepID=A0A2B7Y988_9EURO|nr:5'/3'-nucleotidase SurE [Helicocarpus griseus UAMH5409]